MSMLETVALGRSKRATAGNRMRELLEKAHQQDNDDLFAEEEGDEEFEAPQDLRDVFLDEFADTDEEVEMDEEEEERAIRREERRKAKGKGKTTYNPLASGPKIKKVQFPADPTSSSRTSSPGPSSAQLSILDPSIDPNTMAPTTLILALRKQRREAKRLNRSVAIRSTLRASTLRTEEDILEREKAEKENPIRKGRRAQHETGEIRVVRKMTQDELIAAALEEEERNKEALRDWVRKEEERRELRRVGRKRVKGPRWTWISRTVGKMVEEVEEQAGTEKRSEVHTHSTMTTNTAAPTVSPKEIQSDTIRTTTSNPADISGAQVQTANAKTSEVTDEPKISAPKVEAAENQGADRSIAQGQTTQPPTSDVVSGAQAQPHPATTATDLEPSLNAPTPAGNQTTQPSSSTAKSDLLDAVHVAPRVDESTDVPTISKINDDTGVTGDTGSSQYMRNYMILSQIPGGLPAELKVVLGDHVEWDEVKYIPHRSRPINRRPTISPFTGQPAKYRHPETMIPYSSVEEYKEIQALLKHRYMWSEEASAWFGGEEDESAEGAQEISGWRDALHGGWMGGKEVSDEVDENVVEEDELPRVEVEETGRKGKRKGDVAEAKPNKKSKGGRGMETGGRGKGRGAGRGTL